MDEKEIERYVSLGSRRVCCVYRERLEGIDLYAISIYVTGSAGQYSISVEFDPVTMIDEGEGWKWRSGPMELAQIIPLLENFIGKSISQWENVTKSGRLEYFECDSNEQMDKEQDAAFRSIGFGEKQLPLGFVWERTPFDASR